MAKSDALQTNLRKHIEYLASDKLKGRRTGEAGAMEAAAYVANQFTKLKLRPGMHFHDGARPGCTRKSLSIAVSPS